MKFPLEFRLRIVRHLVQRIAVSVAICGAMAASGALAATYHVAKTGSDSTGNGSSASPWQTIKYASIQVPGGLGHTIQVATGTYTETGGFSLRVGTNLVGAGIDQTILTGSGDVGSGTRVLVYLNSDLDNTIGQRLTGFTIDGMNRTVPSGIQVYKRHFVEIDNVKVKDVYNPGMEFKSSYGASNGTTPPAENMYIRGHKIHDNILEHCGETNYSVTSTGKRWTDWDGAVQIVQDKDCEIYNNTFVNTNIEDGAAIKGFTSGGWHSNLKVYDNVTSNARRHVETAGDTTQWGSTASIELRRCEDDTEIYNNTFDQWTSFPNSSKGNGTYGLVFHDNTVVLPAGGQGGEAIEVGSDLHMYYNYCSGFKLGIATTNTGGTTNLLVHDNVFVGASSYSSKALGLGRSGSNYKFYNNTFDNWEYLANFGGNGVLLSDITFKNNVVTNMPTLVNVQSGTTLANVLFDHNLFYTWSTQRIGNQTQPITWTNNLGDSAPGVDPGLIASGEKPVPWYTAAASTSAVVDAGVIIPGITDGYVGAAPDLGAYEYGGTGGGVAGYAVTFETSQGYNLGAVNGQGGWIADGAWNVVSNPLGGGNSVRANSGVRYQSLNRSFTATEIGGALDTSSSVLAYQFDYHADSGIAGYKVQRFAVGGDYGYAPSFQPRSSSDNVWRYKSGGSEYTAVTATGQSYSFLGKGWVTIDGVIDYATKRYTLFVDGVQQLGGTSDGWLSFPNGTDPSKLGARFYGYVDQVAAPIHLDNILLEVQP